MQRWDAPAGETEDQSKEEEPKVDGDIPFAQSYLVSNRFRAHIVAGGKNIIGCATLIGKILYTTFKCT